LATKKFRNYFFAMLQLGFCFPCKWGKHNLSTKVIRDPMPSSTAYRDEQKSLARTQKVKLSETTFFKPSTIYD